MRTPALFPICTDHPPNAPPPNTSRLNVWICGDTLGPQQKQPLVPGQKDLIETTKLVLPKLIYKFHAGRKPELISCEDQIE